jgi:hypothetical protein
MNERMALSSLHTVRVPEGKIGITKDGNGKASSPATLAWRGARKDRIRNPGRYRQDRTRSRVMDRSANTSSAVIESGAAGSGV